MSQLLLQKYAYCYSPRVDHCPRFWLSSSATSEKPSKFWFERIVMLLWLVCCMLLSNSFAGTMRANLIVVQPTFRFKTLNDVLRHPEMTIVYPANTPAENMINVSEPLQTKGPHGNRFVQPKTSDAGLLSWHTSLYKWP